MALFQSQETSALAELTKYQGARSKLESELSAAAERLQVLQTTRAEIELTALLDATDPAPMRAEVRELQTTIEGLQAARPRLLMRIRGAIVKLATARANVIRKAADKIKARLQAHEAKMFELKKALETHCECPWQPVLQEVVSTGTGLVMHNPLIHRLRAELRTQLDIADGIERSGKQAGTGGTVTAQSLEGLLAVSQNVEALAPTEAPIRAWFERATAAADRMWERRMLDFPGGQGARMGRATGVPQRAAVQYTLAWDADGVIDEARSSILNLEDVSGRVAPNPPMGPPQDPNWPSPRAVVGAES